MLPNFKCLTFSGMSAIVVLCQRPPVILTSHKPYAHLHVPLPRTDVASTTAWLYVAKRATKCSGGSLVHTCTTVFCDFIYLFPFLVRTDMRVVVLCLCVSSP
jgi:hypothetical protein